MTRPRRHGRAPLAAAGLLAALLGTVGCMPWVVGETARTVEPGRAEWGTGVALVAPPDRPERPLPVPQAWVAYGLAPDADVAATYVLPLTFHARYKRRAGALAPGPAVAFSAGAGVHGLPDVAEAGRVYWTPLMTFGIHAGGGDAVTGDGRGDARVAWYAAVRALVPFVLGDEPAATLWVVPQAGAELGAGRLRWGPELGVVVPTVHPRDTQLLLGLSARWISVP